MFSFLGQRNRLGVEETLICCLLIVVGLRGGGGVRSLKSSYVEKSKSHKEGKFLWECGGGGEGEAEKLPKELTSRLVYLNYLPFSISAFFDVKRYMHYIKFFLLKSHKH